jgi:hypothetical protein
MDRWELEEAFGRHYGGAVIRQGWISVTGRGAHWGTYQLGDTTFKKYTIYLQVEPEGRVEVIVTAKLGNPPNASFERQYDAIVQSIGPLGQ